VLGPTKGGIRYDPHVTLGATGEPVTDVVSTVIPAPVSFPGMPRPRWWAFEDGEVHLGDVDAAPEDVARLALMEFALVYGNDFFLVPLDLPVGAVCETRSLVVTDTFGQRSLVDPSDRAAGAAGPWRLYRPSLVEGASGAPPELFVLAPALLGGLHGEPLEDVAFLRDEMANMAWAVERRVAGSTDRPVDRFEAAEWERASARRALDDAAEAAPAPPAEPKQTLAYRLATSVPAPWVPLVPVRVLSPGGAEHRRLQLRPMLDEAGAPLVPYGRILREGGVAPSFPDEEIPREGLRITRAYQHTRWIGGSTHVWVGRRTSPGRGEGSSGLRFDALDVDA